MAICQEHLKATEAFGSEVSHFLEEFLLVNLVSELDRLVDKILEDRFEVIPDPGLRRYALEMRRNAVRGLKYKELRELVQLFGDKSDDYYTQMLKGNDELIQRHDGMIRNRNSIAHGSGAQVTLAEIAVGLNKTEDLLQIVRDSISMT